MKPVTIKSILGNKPIPEDVKNRIGGLAATPALFPTGSPQRSTMSAQCMKQSVSIGMSKKSKQ